MPLMKKLILGANIDFDASGVLLWIVKVPERILELMADGALNSALPRKNLIKYKQSF
jgi:hypothetical protein